MGVGAGLYMYDIVVEKFTFAISSPDEFLLFIQFVLTYLLTYVRDELLCFVVPFQPLAGKQNINKLMLFTKC